MNTTDRLYCTHCTFGSSALETASADNAAKVLGYSVRASSLPGSERGRLRQVFRSIERLLSYELPRDASPADKESLDATSAPRRLIFLPLLGDCQVLGQVCYRSHDTAGRPGSYFADMIVSRVDDRQPDNAWSPLDCLRLWSASADNTSTRDWWCESEERLPHEVADNDAAPLPPVTSLAAVWEQGGGPLVTDAAFLQFLNDDSPLGAPDDNAPGVIPTRWKHIPVVKRRELFARLLQATMNVMDRGRETITIAVEPPLAALLFYGICRLLPERLIRHSREHQGISFSTYEPFPERPMTTLVATTFLHDGSAIDLPAEVYQRGFTCNTFAEDFRYGRVTEPGEYVQRVLEVLISDAGSGMARLEALLAAIDSLPRLSVRSLDTLIRIDEFVNQYVAGDKPLAEFPYAPRVQSNSEEDLFRRSRFVSAIERRAHEESTSGPRDLLEVAIAWCGGDLGTIWAGGGSLSHVLRTHLPSGRDAESRLKQLLSQKTGGQTIPDEIALDAVAKVAEQDSRIPSFIADFLKPRGSQAADWIQRLLQRLNESSREKIVLGSNLSALGEILSQAIDHGGQDHPLLRPAAAEQVLCHVLDDVDRPPDQKWAVLVERAGLLKQVATSRTRLPQSLDRLFGVINGSPPRQLAGKNADLVAEILKRWADLSSAPAVQKQIIDGWKSLHTVLDPVIAEAHTRNERKFSLGGKAVPAEPLKNVATKLAYLSPAPGFGAWTPQLAAKRKRLLETALKSRGIASGDTKLIASWVEPHLQQPEQVFNAPPRRRTFGRELALGFVIAAVVATAAAGAIVFLQGFSFKDFFPPQVAHNQEKAPPHNTKPPQNKSDTPQSKPEQSDQPAMAEGQTPAPSTTRPAQKEPPTPRKPITEEAIGLKLRFHQGKLMAEWDDKLLSGIPFEITVSAPGQEPLQKTNPKSPYEHPASSFGAYRVKLSAKPENAERIEPEKELELPKPPPPKITGLQLNLNDPKTPRLIFNVKTTGDLAQYGPPDQLKCRATLGELELGVIDLPQKDNSGLASFPIDTSAWKPDDIRNGTFQLQVQTPQDRSEPSNQANLDRALFDNEISGFLSEQQKQLTVLGIEGVWPIAEKPDPIPLHPFVGQGEVQLALLVPRFRQQDNTQNTSLRLSELGSEEWEVTNATNDASHGRFRIVRDNPWRPILHFQPPREKSDAQEDRPLLFCKLVIQLARKPFEVQLVRPAAAPPLILDFEWNQPILAKRQLQIPSACPDVETISYRFDSETLSALELMENTLAVRLVTHAPEAPEEAQSQTLNVLLHGEPAADCKVECQSPIRNAEGLGHQTVILGNLNWARPLSPRLKQLVWRKLTGTINVQQCVVITSLNQELKQLAGTDREKIRWIDSRVSTSKYRDRNGKDTLLKVSELSKSLQNELSSLMAKKDEERSDNDRADIKNLNFLIGKLAGYETQDDLLSQFVALLLADKRKVDDYMIRWRVCGEPRSGDDAIGPEQSWATGVVCDASQEATVRFNDPRPKR